MPGSAGTPLRVSLVLSGAVSLGTYEAGVVHELMAAMEHGAPLHMDVVAGASAGALIGSIAARSLLTGAPYSPGFRRWTEVTLGALTEFYERPAQARQRGKTLDTGMLSTELIRRMVRDYLVNGAPGVPFVSQFPSSRVLLVMTMTNLDGLPGTGMPGDEFRYGETVTFRLQRPVPDAEMPRAVWERMGQVALASAAFPGMFDPVSVDWIRRLSIPGVAEEWWENHDLLERLHERFPGLQAYMRYADGGIMDNQPLERAIAALPLLLGEPGQPGPESLVYDPYRLFVFVEPDPPVTALEEVSSGRPMGLITTLGRGIRLFTVAASPYVSRRRVLAGNARILRLLEFLAVLAQRMGEGYRPTGSQDVLEQAFAAMGCGEPAVAAAVPPLLLSRVQEAAAEPGLVDPGHFSAAVPAFYAWLADTGRSEADMAYLEQIGARRLVAQQRPLRDMLRVLREAYNGLYGLDPSDSRRYQRMLEDAHATLALSLGLNRPWVLLSYIAPEDPKMFLRGEELLHFGGFFSEEFLRHDFEVGRFYAQHWLSGAVPDYVPDPPPPPPRPSEEGISWAHVVANTGPLRRIGARLLAGTGWTARGAGATAAGVALGLVLATSAASALLWAVATPVRWLTGKPDLVEAQGILAAGGALFPLALAVLLAMVVPRPLYWAALRHWWKGRSGRGRRQGPGAPG